MARLDWDKSRKDQLMKSRGSVYVSSEASYSRSNPKQSEVNKAFQALLLEIVRKERRICIKDLISKYGGTLPIEPRILYPNLRIHLHMLAAQRLILFRKDKKRSIFFASVREETEPT